MLINMEADVKDQNTVTSSPFQAFPMAGKLEKKICVTLITEMERSPNKEDPLGFINTYMPHIH